MDLSDRIKEMLGKGLQQSVVASAVGCDPSYISQLMEDEHFRSDVLIARASLLESGVKRDNSWDEIEDMALSRARDGMQFLTNPRDLIRIAHLANNAKRRAEQTQNSGIGDGAAPHVTLVFSQQAAIQLNFNRESQVIAVEGRSMQPLATKKLAEMASSLSMIEENQVQIPQLTPSAARESEKKKVLSTLEAIGMADSPPHVQNVMENA